MQGSEESQSSYPSSTMIRREDPSRSPLSTASVGNKSRNNLFQVCALWKILLRPHYFAKLGFRNWWHYRTILSCNLWFLTLNGEDMSKISLNISPLHLPLHKYKTLFFEITLNWSDVRGIGINIRKFVRLASDADYNLTHISVEKPQGTSNTSNLRHHPLIVTSFLFLGKKTTIQKSSNCLSKRCKFKQIFCKTLHCKVHQQNVWEF